MISLFMARILQHLIEQKLSKKQRDQVDKLPAATAGFLRFKVPTGATFRRINKAIQLYTGLACWVLVPKVFFP